VNVAETLLETKDLKKYFPITKGLILSKVVAYVKAVDGISFSINKGDTFGLVGESGCGKTTVSKLILLLESITGGSILFRGKDISRLSKEKLKEYRSSVQAMFQDPDSSLNPRQRVGDIIREPIETNLNLTKEEIRERISEILSEVGLDPACAQLYPHEFSGGQKQRIALARAMAISPSLVILDEPVSALDVSVRAQLMNLLMDVQQRMGLTYMVIAHDLAVVRHMSNRIAVMYLGKLVEHGNSEAVYTGRLHPYTKALLSAALPSHPDAASEEIILPGEVPSPLDPPTGCHFHPRCLHVKDVCQEVEPPLEDAETDHQVACHFWKEMDDNRSKGMTSWIINKR
jgi:oligopeptide transport system ATP-binding protein